MMRIQLTMRQANRAGERKVRFLAKAKTSHISPVIPPAIMTSNKSAPAKEGFASGISIASE
jgi:hypothetical protein